MPDPGRTLTVGVISDTHGLLRPQALRALSGSDLIVHAGDVGKPEILEALRQIAPLHAVRGNVDHGEWAAALPRSEVVQAGDALLYVLHDLGQLDLDPAASGFAAVISGHSHRPTIDRVNGVLYLNPGSAGPKRFSLSATLARLEARGREVEAQLIRLDV